MTYAVFKMWDERRRSLVRRHEFYVEQARKRLFSQFKNVEAEADEAAEKWLEESGRYFDPDRYDPGDFHDQAYEVGIEFYGLLKEMRENTRLSVVAGMYHEWEKQLREWLTSEILRILPSGHTATKIWSTDFEKMTDFLVSLGWNVRNADYFSGLDACRLVVNVYKHGKGTSLDDLKAKYPEYLADPFAETGRDLSDVRYRDHSHLKVTDAQFQALSESILAFWGDVPESIFDTQVGDVPKWLEKAVRDDQADRKQAKDK
jgi:hypothetical protein